MLYGTLDGNCGRIVDARCLLERAWGFYAFHRGVCRYDARSSASYPRLAIRESLCSVLLPRRQHKGSGGDGASARFAM